MDTETCQTKTLADCPWRNTEIYFSRHEFCSDAIIISSSTRFAMIRIFSFEKHIPSRIYVYDLFKGKINRILLEPEWKRPAYCYWLNDDVISIFDENAKKQKYVHYFYHINLDDTKSRLQLITKCDYTYQATHPARNTIDISGNVCKITIHYHDFLFVKNYEFLLVPYNLLAPGPHLPLLKMNMLTHIIKGDQFFADKDTAFSYRDKLYFELRNGDKHLLAESHPDWDQVRWTELNVRTITNGEMAHTCLDHDDATIFLPRKLNQGSYISAFGAQMSQDGPLVLFYENIQSPTTLKKRKFWLLNLENGTISEKIIEEQRFTEAHLYRGFLLLWDMHNSKMKYHWINNHVPALSDICRVTVSAYNHQPQSWLRQTQKKNKAIR